MAHAAGLVVTVAGLGVIGFSLYELLAPKTAGAAPTATPKSKPSALAHQTPATPTAASLVAGGFDLSPCGAHGGYKDAACVTAYQGALSYLAPLLGKPAWIAPPSGVLDAATTAAVKAFQADNPPLKVDGKVGKGTAAKIVTLVAANLPAALPASVAIPPPVPAS